MALIIREEPGCESNIGRIVIVSGPVIDCHPCGPTWLIEPVTLEHWSFSEYRNGSVSIGPITFEDRIEHPDAWLQPIRSEVECDQLTQEIEKQLLVEESV